ncbi:Guanine nucleotide-binding-like protein 1 [Apophysomyces sp. BC1021]|nr:Guanine nucleotide-binding-like protein 1 [Apophysomyces sp. BC1021]
MSTHRRIPFSGKKKKLQLQEKKARKANKGIRDDNHDDLSETFVPSSSWNVAAAHPETADAATGESKRTQTELEINVDSFKASIDFPKRPKWEYEMTKEQVEAQEEEAFQNWVKDVNEKYGNADDGTELSWFEHNLEVWRQLWRVLEISDIILVVMDIRHPLLHFPRALYEYVVKDLSRKIVGVFNKASSVVFTFLLFIYSLYFQVDLVSEFTVFAWRKYFEEQFPELHLACFSCYPRDKKLIDDTKTYALKSRVKRPRNRYYQAQGVRDILSACRDVHLRKHGADVDWEGLIQRYENQEESVAECAEISSDDESDTGSMVGLEDEFSQIMDIHHREVTPHRDFITLGLVGHPNVGKSSLVNSIMGKTVVSASRTPGHTKHFQTIHLTENVRLCDSPGLVFPTLLPRALQAERIPLEKILSLTPPELELAKSYQWSAWSICEAFADQRGFYTAKAARPDVYRAANAILRLVNDGRILLSFKPSGFFLTTKYEKLKIEEVDAAERAQEEEEARQRDGDSSHSEEEQTLNIQTGGGFALLADAE